ncbi:hypothetical protein AMR62_22970 [Salmonella enterica]|nr:hypothetical protein [Salmonella enterica]
MWFQICTVWLVFLWLYLCVVTKVTSVGARRLRWEVLLVFSNRRGRESAVSEGIFVFVHRSFKDNDFPCGGATQGLKYVV